MGGAGAGGPVVLARNPAVSLLRRAGLAWSPDGTQLAFASGAGIWLVTIGQPGDDRSSRSVPCAGTRRSRRTARRSRSMRRRRMRSAGQTAIMVANTDGSGIHTLSAVPFRPSVDPGWQPASGDGAWRPAQASRPPRCALHPLG